MPNQQAIRSAAVRCGVSAEASRSYQQSYPLLLWTSDFIDGSSDTFAGTY